MAHRYWRLNFHNAAGQVNSAAEIEFHSTVGGSNVIAGGTASASSVNGSFTAANAADGNTSTFWATATSASSSQWIYDFGSGNSVDVQEVKLTPRQDGFFAECCTVFDVQFSDDNSTWTTSWSSISLTGGNFANATARTFNTTSVLRRVLFNYASTALQDGACSCAEMAWHATIGGSTDVLSGSVVGSRSNGSHDGPAAHDGNASTFWSTLADSTDQSLAIDYGFGGTAPTVVEIVITARNDGFHGETAKTISFQSSTDNVTWATIWMATTTTAWTSGASQTFTQPAPSGNTSNLFFVV